MCKPLNCSITTRRKLDKLPEKERKEIEGRIAESQALMRKQEREEKALMRMPRGERLKKICGKAIEACFRFSFEYGVAVGARDIKVTKGEVSNFNLFRTQAKSGLTWQLKKAGVLPLEG